MPAFTTGTRLFFQQASAPTGWNRDLTYTDHAIRIVSGIASSGGIDNFTSVHSNQTNVPAGVDPAPLASWAASSSGDGGTPAHTHTYTKNTQPLSPGTIWTGPTGGPTTLGQYGSTVPYTTVTVNPLMTTDNIQDIVATVTATLNTTGNVTITAVKGTISSGMAFIATGTAFGGLTTSTSGSPIVYYITALSGIGPSYTATLRRYDIASGSATSTDSGVLSTTALVTTVGTGSVTFTSTNVAGQAPPDVGYTATTHTHNIGFGLKATTGTGSIDFRVKYVDLLLASKAAIAGPTYVFGTQSTTSVQKGNPISFTLNTTGVTAGTVLYYTVFNVGFTGAVSANQTGTFTLGTNTATFSVTIADNGFYDYGGSFIIQVRTGSTIGPVVASSVRITIVEFPPTISIAIPGSGGISEGGSGTFVVTTTKLRNGTILNYAVNNLTVQDVRPLTGTLVINNNSGSFTIEPALDIFVETATKIFTVTVSYYGFTATSANVNLYEVSPTISFSIYDDNNVLITGSSFDEGKAYEVRIATTLIPNNTSLTYALSNNNAFAQDWDYPTSGATVVFNNTAKFFFKVKSDFLTETVENFNFSVTCLGITKLVGDIVGFTINDISKNPSDVSIVNPITTITEDQTIQYSITTSAVDNTQLMWKITPITPATAPDFLAISGLITTFNNAGTFTITTIPSRLFTSNSGKTFNLNIFDSTGTTNYTNSTTVYTITDLYSAGSFEILLPVDANITEGKTLLVPLLCTNAIAGVTYYWSLEPSTVIAGTNLNDFTPASVYGSFTLTATTIIDSNTLNYKFITTFGVGIYSDYLTEGIEGFILKITTEANGAGTVVATSNLISILDTTYGGVVTFVNPSTTIDESTLGTTFTITTTNFPSNFNRLYWNIAHGSTTNADFSAVSGLITVIGNTGTFTITPLMDGVPENDETFVIEVRLDSITGTRFAYTDVTIAGQQYGQVTVTYSDGLASAWTVPTNASYISAVAIGGGGGGTGNGIGGGGGALMYIPNYPVVPGTIYSIMPGRGGAGGQPTPGTGGSSWIRDSNNKYLIYGEGGQASNGVQGTGGGTGVTSTWMASTFITEAIPLVVRWNGGTTNSSNYGGAAKYNGNGISNSTQSLASTSALGISPGGGTLYGAGGTSWSGVAGSGSGLNGVVRIIWWNSKYGANFRAYPSTNVGDI